MEKNVTIRIKDLLYAQKDITAAFIYGSFLLIKEYRDIDIGIFTAIDIPGLKKLDYEHQLEQLLLKQLPGLKFDIRILNSAPDRFLYNVFKGKFLFAKEDKIFDIMERVIAKCLDEQYYIDQYYRYASQG